MKELYKTIEQQNKTIKRFNRGKCWNGGHRVKRTKMYQNLWIKGWACKLVSFHCCSSAGHPATTVGELMCLCTSGIFCVKNGQILPTHRLPSHLDMALITLDAGNSPTSILRKHTHISQVHLTPAPMLLLIPPSPSHSKPI